MASLTVCMADAQNEMLVLETLPSPEEGEPFIEAARKLIGCDWIEFVQLLQRSV